MTYSHALKGLGILETFYMIQAILIKELNIFEGPYFPLILLASTVYMIWGFMEFMYWVYPEGIFSWREILGLIEGCLAFMFPPISFIIRKVRFW
jgi:hypothetical protein